MLCRTPTLRSHRDHKIILAQRSSGTVTYGSHISVHALSRLLDLDFHVDVHRFTQVALLVIDFDTRRGITKLAQYNHQNFDQVLSISRLCCRRLTSVSKVAQIHRSSAFAVSGAVPDPEIRDRPISDTVDVRNARWRSEIIVPETL